MALVQMPRRLKKRLTKMPSFDIGPNIMAHMSVAGDALEMGSLHHDHSRQDQEGA